LKGLTGLRGFAALTVYVAHNRFEDLIPALHPVCAFFEWHPLAVDLFFMLSGFLLVHVYKSRLGLVGGDSWLSYLAARFARIVPLYLITFIATMGLFMAGSLVLNKWPAYITWEIVLTNLLLLQNWPGFFQGSLNIASWSLSVEFLCYVLIMPVALLLSRRLLRPWSVVAGLALLMMARALVGDTIDGWVALTRGVTCFLAGGLLHRFHAVPSDRCMVGAAVLGAAVFLALRSLSTWGGLFSHWVLLSFPFLVVGLAASVDSKVHQFFRSRIMLWLGDISFSMYLWQGPLAMVTYYQIRPRLISMSPAILALWMMVEVCLILVVSTLSFHRIEIPLRNWIRSRLAAAASH
jgi:peptidoglycan/LPS O-acetylase OafA/YrhL